MIITTTPSRAFVIVEMDIVGPFNNPVDGFDHILTMQCNLTKFSEVIPIIDQTAETVAEAIAVGFICKFGCPGIIKTDQGSNFQSQLMANFAKLFKIQLFKSTALRPQTMGSIERNHHSLIEY